jgi:hypothetical protein
MTTTSTNTGRSFAPFGALKLGAAALVWLSAATASQASTTPYDDLKISSTIANSINYQIGSGLSTTVVPNNNATFRASANDGGFVSELGFDLTSNLSGDDFSYLHNAYCVGNCSVSMTTNLTFTLTNSGDAPLDVRWDSMITPGHLAQVGLTGAAQFSFEIVQGLATLGANSLYSAAGLTGGYYDQIQAPGGQFNGLLHQDYSETPAHLNAKTISDWSATNVDLNLLTINPGTTSTLQYYSQASVSNSMNCTSLETCDGVQIAFGDPRTSGTTTNFARAFFALPTIEGANTTAQPIIGREFDPYTITSAFVTPDTPLPHTPAILPPVTYGPTFVSQVPEPASWIFMLGGFVLTGAVVRRRPQLVRAIA